MNDTPRLFPINDPAFARNSHQWLMPRGVFPTPILDAEWQKVSKALLAAGEHDLHDKISRRRSQLLSEQAEIAWVADRVRERNDPRQICSSDVHFRIQAVVTFSGHGSFSPDGAIGAMVDDFNRQRAYVYRPGLGELNECVTALSQIYCG